MSVINWLSPYFSERSTMADVLTSMNAPCDVLLMKGKQQPRKLLLHCKNTKNQRFMEKYRTKVWWKGEKCVPLQPQNNTGPFVYRLGREIFIL